MLLIAGSLLASALGLLGLLYALHCAGEGYESRDGFHFKGVRPRGVDANLSVIKRASNRAKSGGTTLSDRFGHSSGILVGARAKRSFLARMHLTR